MGQWDNTQQGKGTDKADRTRGRQPSDERAGVIFSYYQWVGQPHQMEQWSMERSQISLGRRKVAVEPRVKKGAVPCVKPCPLSGTWVVGVWVSDGGWVWARDGDWRGVGVGVAVGVGLQVGVQFWDWSPCPGLACPGGGRERQLLMLRRDLQSCAGPLGSGWGTEGVLGRRCS